MESTADTISQAYAVLHQPANGIEPVTLSPGMTGPPIDMHRILVNLDAKVTAGFDGLARRLSSMENLITSVVDDVAHLKSGMNILESNINSVKNVTIPELKSELEDRIKDLEKARLEAEIYTKKNNLLFFNIPQQYGENTEETLLNHLQTVGVPDLENNNLFAVVHRLPPRQAKADHPHPIIAKFHKLKDRNRILSYKPPAGVKYAVAPHLPAQMQEKRRSLIPIRNQLVRDGKNAKIRVTGTQVLLMVNNQVQEG